MKQVLRDYAQDSFNLEEDARKLDDLEERVVKQLQDIRENG